MKSPSSKKTAKTQVTETLRLTFDGLQEKLGKKKFEKNIKKASKALLEGYKETAVKKEATSKKKTKTTKKKTAAEPEAPVA